MHRRLRDLCAVGRTAERGSALLELALAMPIMLAVAGAIVDGGWALHQAALLTAAAEAAQRAAALQDTGAGNCAGAPPGSYADLSRAAAAAAAPTLDATRLSVSVRYLEPVCAGRMRTLIVDVSYTLRALTPWFAGPLNGRSLRAEAGSAVEEIPPPWWGSAAQVRATQAQIQSQQSQIAAQASQIAVQQADFVGLQSQLATDQSQFASQQSQLAADQSVMAGQQNQIADQQNQLATQQSTITWQQSLLTADQGQIDWQQSTIASQQSALAANQSQIASQQSQLAADQSQFASQQSQLAADQSALAAQQNQLNAQQAQIAGQQSQLSAQQSQLASQQSQIDWFSSAYQAASAAYQAVSSAYQAETSLAASLSQTINYYYWLWQQALTQGASDGVREQ